MSAHATRVVLKAIDRFDGRPFTPVLAILMTDNANKALSELGIPLVANIGIWLTESGTLDFRFRPKVGS